MRLDAFLAGRLPDLSRARLQALLRDGHIRRGADVVAEASARVKAGQRFSVVIPPVAPAKPQGEAIPLHILHEDDHLIVVVKPAGMVVHPAPGHSKGTLVNALIGHCGVSLSGIGGVARPGIVHRLDRDVSGVMVVAKNDGAHRALAGQFTVHSIERVYDAVVWGLPAMDHGVIESLIGRHPRDRQRMAVVGRNGKWARTHYRILEAAGTLATHVRCRLETGRTHQIRVHLSHMGHALVGDSVYGGGRKSRLSDRVKVEITEFGRIALHARVLSFEHPATGERLRFEVAPPEVFDRLFSVLAQEARAATA
ncbi:RluA family pseudouridine synthase [Marinivivus vitaminiproducens]|uniref:RluA family pseudouridine synthase n=1 Tax=Marinivivus vitaminiproducens TaxID=3035935 RepID=UPI0027A354B7|nr:RluA family pseudouridine synthase [Geminicoccaceae bacterium SCSIO 64248]